MRSKFLKLPAKISLLLFCVYFGYNYSNDIDKLELNLLEKRTNVKEGYYQNITNLDIFLDKEEGYFVPKYGTFDKKIEIGSDLAPKDMYGLLEERVKNGEYNFGKTVSLFSATFNSYSDSLDEIEKRELINYLDSLSFDLKKNDVNYIIKSLNDYVDSLLDQ